MNHLDLKSFDGVAFDLEGTLADTIPTHHAARKTAFEAHGYGHITPEQHALGPTYGSTPVDIIGGVLHAAGITDGSVAHVDNPMVLEVVESKNNLYRQLAANGFDQMPGAVDFVKLIAPLFVGRIALVTSAEQEYVFPFLDRFGLRSYFPDEMIISANTVNDLGRKGKPYPDPYLIAMDKLGTSNLLVFEDTVPGVESAKKAGATVVALGFEPENAKIFREWKTVDDKFYFVNDYDEAKQLLGL